MGYNAALHPAWRASCGRRLQAVREVQRLLHAGARLDLRNDDRRRQHVLLDPHDSRHHRHDRRVRRMGDDGGPQAEAAGCEAARVRPCGPGAHQGSTHARARPRRPLRPRRRLEGKEIDGDTTVIPKEAGRVPAHAAAQPELRAAHDRHLHRLHHRRRRDRQGDRVGRHDQALILWLG